MPRRLTPLSVAFSLALFFVAHPANAQNRPDILPREGQKALQKEYSDAKFAFSTFHKKDTVEAPLVQVDRSNKDQEKAIDAVAQWHTYRLTWEPLEEGDGLKKQPKFVTEYGVVDELLKEFNIQVALAESESLHKANPVFCEVYLKMLALRARDVMLSRKPIAVVNAARMLSRLAKAGSEDAADACLDAIKNDNSLLEPKVRMGAQYWALEGLGNILGRWSEAPVGPDAPPMPAERKAKEAKYVAMLDGVIGQFMPADGKLPTAWGVSTPDEVAGLRLFRRQAVRALAQFRGPAIADDKDGIKVKSALTLLKVINNDGLVPPVKLDEQVEAAWGVARIRSSLLKSYQPAYAARQVGNVVVDLAAGAKKFDRKFAWKYHAARLADALEVMKAEAKDDPNKAADYINPLVTDSLRILKDIETLESANAATLKDWLGKTPLPGGVSTLYKNDPASVVRQPGEAPPPPKPDKPMDKPGDTKPVKPVKP